MAPESFIQSSYNDKSDVWALGILIFEMFHGNSPYAFCKMENDLRYHLSLPFNKQELRADISPSLRDVICRCLETNPTKRISFPELRNHPYFRLGLARNNVRQYTEDSVITGERRNNITLTAPTPMPHI